MDQGNLIARKMCLLLKVKRPVPTRSMNSVCTKNLAFQIEQGNLWNCLKTFASCMLTMEQGNLWNQAQAHTQWKNNLLLKKIVTLRYSTRTTSSTVQSTRRTSVSTFQDYHSAVKQSHGINVQGLIQKIENHPHRHALQSDLQQRQQFNPFSKESKKHDSCSWQHRIMRTTRCAT